jgi:hypothetical protein
MAIKSSRKYFNEHCGFCGQPADGSVYTVGKDTVLAGYCNDLKCISAIKIYYSSAQIKFVSYDSHEHIKMLYGENIDVG